MVPVLLTICLVIGTCEAYSYEECVTAKEGYLVCQRQRSSEWRGIYAKYGSGERMSIGGVVVQNEPTGAVIPVTRENCRWPAAMAEGQRMPSFNGEYLNDWVRTHRWKYRGFYGNYMDEETQFDMVYDCSSAHCPDLNMAWTNMSIMVDIEDPTKITSTWVTNNKWAKRTNKLWCYVDSTQTAVMNSLMQLCHVVIGNGYDGPRPCHVRQNFAQSFLDSWSWRDLAISIGMYGYDTSDTPCAGLYEGKPVVQDNTTVGSNCRTTGNTGTTFYPQTQGNCRAPTPAQLWELHKTEVMHEAVKYIFGWTPAPADMGNWRRRVDMTREMLEYMGNDMTGYSAGSSCSVVKMARLDKCYDIIWITADMRSCKGEITRNGYVGKRVCMFECKSQFTMKACDGAVCRAPRETIYKESTNCMITGRGVLIEMSAEYAKTGDGRRCTGFGDALLCEGTVFPKELCGRSKCTPLKCNENEFEIACSNGLCMVDDQIVPDSGLGRRRKLQSIGSIGILRQGGSMVVTYSGDDEKKSCKLSGGGKVLTWECDSDGCMKGFDLVEFQKETHVIVECGSIREGFVWTYTGPAGISTGIDGVDWALDVYAELKWWQQAMIAILVISGLQLLLTLVGGKKILASVWRLLRWVGRAIVDIRGAAHEFWRNWAWFFRTDKFCKGCGADMAFVDHTKGCPFYKSGQQEMLSGVCPLLCRDGICMLKVEKDEEMQQRHWTAEHLQMYNQPIVMWCMNLLNWLKNFRISNGITKQKKMEMQEAMKKEMWVNTGGPFMKKGVRGMAYVAVVCALINPSMGLANIVGSGTCTGNDCSVSANIVQEGLWMNDQSCYRVQVGTGYFDICMRGTLLSMKTQASVAKCRAEFDVHSWGIVACASAGACDQYAGELDSFKACGLVSDENIKYSGYTGWGCALPNVNSLCNKAVMVSTGAWKYCMVNAKSTGFDAGMCVIYKGKSYCGNGTVQVENLKISWTIQAKATESLSGNLLVGRDGTVRRVVTENGCTGLYTENFGIGGCANPVKGFYGKCSYEVLHWWQLQTKCEQEAESSCMDPYAYGMLDGACSVTGLVPYGDGTGFEIESSGCTDGVYKALISINGNVTIEAETGKVESVTASSCEGYSGSASGYSCVVTVRCSGNVASCMLTSPTSAEIACGSSKRVFYTNTQNSTTCFECSGVKACVENEGGKYAPRPDDPHYKPGGDDSGKFQLTWWMILLIVVGALMMTGVIIGVIVACIIRREREMMRQMEKKGF